MGLAFLFILTVFLLSLAVITGDFMSVAHHHE